MHSVGYRANALLTFAVTILALMCGMASLSDNFNSPSPSAHVQVSIFSFHLHFCFRDPCPFSLLTHSMQVLNINWFQKQPNANDEVTYSSFITLNVYRFYNLGFAPSNATLFPHFSSLLLNLTLQHLQLLFFSPCLHNLHVLLLIPKILPNTLCVKLYRLKRIKKVYTCELK